MTDELLIYGSYGYAGALVTETAVDEGLSPVLAGRRAEKVERQATDLGLDHRVFSLEHPEIVEREIGETDVVLNCAGPFSETAEPLVSACLRTGTDYLDIAGRVEVLEWVASRDPDAERADVALLPGVGFDVVPTDCLAAHLESRLPSATHLTLGVDGLGTFSPGTLKSIVDGLSGSGITREDGALRSVPVAWKTRRIDFGEGPKQAVTVPWGDLSTAYYSTGIPNIETYATVPEPALAAMRRTRPLVPFLRSRPIQAGLKRLVDATVSGPTAEDRAQSSTRVWGEAVDDEDERVAARLRTPDTYDLTARTSVEAARRALDGDVPSGFQTPASAFGPDFPLAFDGVEREEGVELESGAASGVSGPGLDEP
jgi:short subunit dehydrogenase-like uncharacterized protein